MFILKRDDLLAAGVCGPGLEMLDERNNGEDCVYPDGWTNYDALRVYTRNPRFLKWLEKQELVPTVWFPADPNHPLLTESCRVHFADRFINTGE